MLRLVLRESRSRPDRCWLSGRISAASVPEGAGPPAQIGTVSRTSGSCPTARSRRTSRSRSPWIGSRGTTIAKVVPETLALVGLGGKEKRYPMSCPGAKQQRVAIARAFVNRPIISWPTNRPENLDPTTSWAS